ncbi:E3 ubiquitin-protein ligase RNF10-like [Parasteatoda tepidariorum]|uniref:E3 ubiquitin-protein ligase RNF10-like n=1 Tax=Parasteatoda tepidariorum TaxID=114398 RepID=UPI001C7277D3|nr:RING finger protein 10-like [Parasteatoda tepidariorum]
MESAFTLLHERDIALNQNVDQLKELIYRSNGNVPERKHLISTSSAESYEELPETEDGQHICIHNINVKMLLKEYCSLEFAPETTKLVEIERVTMTEVSNPLVLNFLVLRLFR